MNHSFNIELAQKYGIEEAIIIEHFAFWIKKNVANKNNYFEGEYWTYNSAKALEELFPYMNLKKIQRVLTSLEKMKIFKSGNFNESKYDRTKWYCIVDPEIKAMYNINYSPSPLDKMSNEKNQEVSKKESSKSASVCHKTKRPMKDLKMSNEMEKNVQPIPDINSYINTYTTTTKLDNINKIDPQTKKKNSSRSSLYEFLNKYDLTEPTKFNIRQNIVDLTEEKFDKTYKDILKESKTVKFQHIEAVLYKALKGEWVLKTIPVPPKKEETEKRVLGICNYYLNASFLTPQEQINKFLEECKNKGFDSETVEKVKLKMILKLKEGA